MGTGPVIAIVIVTSFLGFIAMLVVRSGAKPRAARLVGRSESLSITAVLRQPDAEEHRVLFELELGADASDAEQLTEALGRSGSVEALAQAVIDEVLPAWSAAQGPPALRALDDGVDPALSSALRSAFAERGVQLRQVGAWCVSMTPALRHLATVWLTRCTRGGPTGRSESINALEVYIDGISGRGTIYTASSRGAGTRRERTRSTELVEDPSRSVRYTVGKPTGMVHLDTLQELMRP